MPRTPSVHHYESSSLSYSRNGLDTENEEERVWYNFKILTSVTRKMVFSFSMAHMFNSTDKGRLLSSTESINLINEVLEKS